MGYVTTLPGDPLGLISDYFRDAGGSDDLAVKGDVTPVTYWYTPPVGKSVIIKAIHFIGEGAVGAIGEATFVDIAAITNGLTIQLQRGNTLYALHDRDPSTPADSPFPIKDNGGFRVVTSRTSIQTNITDALAVYWDFEDYGMVLRLHGIKKGGELDKLRIVVRDDLSGITGYLKVKAVGYDEVG